MHNNTPDWIQAGGVVLAVLVAAISVSAVTLYRLDSLEGKVDSLIDHISNIKVLQQEVKDIKLRNTEIGHIFIKFASSVDRLSITVAKLETKLDLMED